MDALVERPGLKTPEADIAYRRIDAILRAYGVQHAALRGLHTQRLLVEAVEQQPRTDKPLEAIAAGLLLLELQTGLTHLTVLLSDETASVNRDRLLIAVKKTLIPANYPDVLLGHAQLDDAEAEALRLAFHTQNKLVLKRSSMGAPTLRFESIDGLTSRVIDFLDRIPYLMRALPVAGIGLILIVIYHFAK